MSLLEARREQTRARDPDEEGQVEVTIEASRARRHVYRIRLDDQELKELKMLAERKRVPAAVVVRELIRQALEAERPFLRKE